MLNANGAADDQVKWDATPRAGGLATYVIQKRTHAGGVERGGMEGGR